MDRLNEIRRKKGKKKIIMLTAYDYQIAKILDEAEIDLILVGDSLGMVILGYPDTRSVTIQEMLHHTRIVAKGSKNTPIIGDMPINSYNTVEEALANAKQIDKLNVFSIVLECILELLSKKITDAVKAPTIGIGAGRYCDGQVLVIN